MVDKEGKEHTNRRSIANVFADFYADLYASKRSIAFDCVDDGSHIPPFTKDEVRSGLKDLKNNRCKDKVGVIAEMLKEANHVLVDLLCETFNGVLRSDAEPPTSWKQTVITVLHKSGDARLPQNYRPISIIPIVYKLFARLLYRRLNPILDAQQCPDQAGFRSNYSTVDHLFTLMQLQEKAHDFQKKLWVSAIDFKKAFDSIEQAGLWHALSLQRVPHAYINLLRSLYSGQTANVCTDVVSKSFDMKRGTKQGDPLSSLLFNALLEHIFRRLKIKWKERGMGIDMGTDERLSNLRFADDVLLVAKKKPHLVKMLEDLQQEALRYGLELHPEKTKILTNCTNKTGRDSCTSIEVNDMNIEILPLNGSVKYLGRKVSFDDFQGVELQNRVRAAWASFMSNRDELTGRQYALKHRLRLFDAVVSPTVLYGCEAWSPTKRDEMFLQRTQRKMLRMILGAKRRTIVNPESNNTVELETWVDWIKRVTHAVEDELSRMKIKNWVQQIRSRRWNYFGRVLTHDPSRWTRIAYTWDPSLHLDGPCFRSIQCSRIQARPRTRWVDDLSKFCVNMEMDENGLLEAWKNQAEWQHLREEFCKEDWRMQNSEL